MSTLDAKVGAMVKNPSKLPGRTSKRLPGPKGPPEKQPNRPHFIPQWAAAKNVTQADIARAIGADKSVVSRWFDGSAPMRPYQVRLAQFFDCTIDALFRDPDEVWIGAMLADRSPEERARIRATIEAAFPRKS